MWNKIALFFVGFKEFYSNNFGLLDFLFSLLIGCVIACIGSKEIALQIHWTYTPAFLSNHSALLFSNAANACLTMLGFMMAAWAILIAAGSDESTYRIAATHNWQTIRNAFVRGTYALAVGCLLSYVCQIASERVNVYLEPCLILVLSYTAVSTFRCIWLLAFITDEMFEDRDEPALDKMLEKTGMTDEAKLEWKKRRLKK